MTVLFGLDRADSVMEGGIEQAKHSLPDYVPIPM